jgi:hypothetical protein
MTDTAQLRTALLELHRLLLQAQRRQAERIQGRMSASELLQAAAEDFRFSWLGELSTLITALDEATAGEEGETEVEAVVERARALLSPPDEGTAFGRRYLKALQDEPDVVLAHRDVVAAL